MEVSPHQISIPGVGGEKGISKIKMVRLFYPIVIQIPYEKVFGHPKLTPRPLAEGIGAYGL